MQPTTEETIDAGPGDGELLVAHRRGDAEAFMALYRRHARSLPLYAASLGAGASAEDFVQEAFLRLLTGDPARLGPSARAFLFVVVRNQAHDQGRRQAVRRDHVPMLVPKDGSGLDAAVAEAVVHALDRLPAEQREAVVLKVYGGLTFAEVGDVTGVPAATATSRYRYALERMADLLAEERRTG